MHTEVQLELIDDVNNILRKLCLYGESAIPPCLTYIHEKDSVLGNLRMAMQYLVPPERKSAFQQTCGDAAKKIKKGGGKTKDYTPCKYS